MMQGCRVSNRRSYQRTVPLDPGAPGTKESSPEIFSPGTGAADCKLDRSLVSSSRDTQAEMMKAIIRSKTAGIAMRLITTGEANYQPI